MRGIRLSHGVTFIECDGATLRISANGKCEISPVSFASLEWELRTEKPEKWEYITTGEAMSIIDDKREQISEVLSKRK